MNSFDRDSQRSASKVPFGASADCVGKLLTPGTFPVVQAASHSLRRSGCGSNDEMRKNLALRPQSLGFDFG